MTIQIDLPPPLEDLLRDEAARRQQAPDEYVRALLHRELVIRELDALQTEAPPGCFEDLVPAIPTEPGKNWLDEIRGKWPGDETDEQIDRALEELS